IPGTYLSVYISKGCAPSSRCPSTDYQSYSVNAGVSHTYATVKCCDTDNCNYDSLPAPPPRPYSGQRCFFCVPGTSDCSLTLQCHEGEDRCFKATGHPAVKIDKGCAPTSKCPATGYHTFSVSVGASRAITSIKCCDSDYCNYEVPAGKLNIYNLMNRKYVITAFSGK
uniref:UPAR/Ly6 domain-containing protein n=1 Tax=Gouania willdenowi TaxID=441366 RepID=A0A8C5DLT6_GOUWI